MEIQRHAPISSQIENILLSRIQDGTYTTDTSFPSESALCEEFKVSRATIRTAVSAITAKGYLVRYPGRGTFLVDPFRLNSGIEQLESVLSIARRQGVTPEIRDLSVSSIKADGTLIKRLECELGQQVSFIERTIYVGNKAYSFHQDFVQSQTLSPSQIKEHFDGSVLDLLKVHHIPQIKEAVTEITSVNASRELSEHLGVKFNSALILLRETVFDEGGEIVSYSENFFVPDCFYLHVLRRKNFINP
jgi:GntR family transcriptional regulator